MNLSVCQLVNLSVNLLSVLKKISLYVEIVWKQEKLARLHVTLLEHQRLYDNCTFFLSHLQDSKSNY